MKDLIEFIAKKLAGHPEDVQIRLAGPPAHAGGSAAGPPLGGLEDAEEGQRLQIGPHPRHAVQEVGLRGTADRRGLAEVTHLEHLDLPGLLQVAEGDLEVGLAVAEVGSESDVGDDHGFIRSVELPAQSKMSSSPRAARPVASR